MGESLDLFGMPIQAVPSRSGTTRVCAECQGSFVPYKRAEGYQAYCSEECRVRAWKHSEKDRGKALAASTHAGWLEAFRRLAEELGRDGAEVSINDVRQLAEARGMGYEPGNWMGSVFDLGWRPVRWEPAQHRDGHGRPVRVWVRR